MSSRKERGPTRPFMHTPDCKIMKADPTTEIKWQEVETGLWVAECRCGKEYERERPRTSVFGSTPWTRPPSAISADVSSGTRPIPQ